MAQKIHPIGYRLAVTQTWWSIMMADKKDNRYYISQEIFIRKLVPEILKKAKYLTSEIIIKRLPEYYHITFLYYRNRNTDLFSSKTSYLINLIKFIIEYLFNVRVYIQAIEIQNYTMNAKILSEWISQELSKFPKKHKQIFKRVIKEFQNNISSNNKYDNIIK